MVIMPKRIPTYPVPVNKSRAKTMVSNTPIIKNDMLIMLSFFFYVTFKVPYRNIIIYNEFVKYLNPPQPSLLNKGRGREKTFLIITFTPFLIFKKGRG